MTQDYQELKVLLEEDTYKDINLDPDEEIKMVIRHHWLGFLNTIVLSFLMLVVPLVLAVLLYVVARQTIMSFGSIIVLIFSSYLLFLLTFILGDWVNFYYDIIFITNKRIININQQGLLSRQTSELGINQVQNVSVEVRGFLQTYFNAGHITIETAGEGTSENQKRAGSGGYFTVDYLPDPPGIARLISELHHEYLDSLKEG